MHRLFVLKGLTTGGILNRPARIIAGVSGKRLFFRRWSRQDPTRATHHGASLADLYDPDLMTPNLRRAHQALDSAVDRLYRRTGFASEHERVERLLALYEKMRTPLVSRLSAKKRRRQKVK